MLKPYLLAGSLLLAVASRLGAVEIPPECRVPNRGPQCVRSNLATLGYVHGIEALQSFAPNRKVIPGPNATDQSVRDQLQERGIKWQGRDTGDYRRDLLPLANSHGVVVTIWVDAPPGHMTGNLHSIILTKYDKDWVDFYCPDNSKRIWRMDMATFNRKWKGNSMVFGLDKAPKAAKSPLCQCSACTCADCECGTVPEIELQPAYRGPLDTLSNRWEARVDARVKDITKAAELQAAAMTAVGDNVRELIAVVKASGVGVFWLVVLICCTAIGFKLLDLVNTGLLVFKKDKA